MSHDHDENVLGEEKKREVVLSVDDIRNIRDFFTHFKVEMTPDLDAVCKRWEEKKDGVVIGDQDDLKVALCGAMLSSSHAMFKDPLFANIIDNSQKICFEASFKKELESTLSEDKK